MIILSSPTDLSKVLEKKVLKLAGPILGLMVSKNLCQRRRLSMLISYPQFSLPDFDWQYRGTIKN